MSFKNVFDMANEDFSGYFITEITEKEYKNRIKNKTKFIKGKGSYYEDKGYVIIEDLPRGKEYYIDEETHYSYENGCEGGSFSVLTTYKNKYLLISFEWSN